MPKRVDHEARRRHIAEALLRIAGDRGLQAATMREVAAEAEVSLRLVQYYFTTKEALLLDALAVLGEQLSARITRLVRALNTPPSPRDIVVGTLTAILPTDEESRRITRTYAAYYTLALSEPAFAARDGGHYPDAMERFLATHFRKAEEAGQIAPGHDPELTIAGLLALVNGLGSSVLGGQRDGAAALAILTYHLERLFGPLGTGAPATPEAAAASPGTPRTPSA